MTVFDATAADQDFSFVNVSPADAIDFLAPVVTNASIYSWMTSTGHLVKAEGSFAYPGGGAVSGLVSNISIDLGSDTDFDIEISGMSSVNINDLIQGHTLFWETLFSDKDQFYVGSAFEGSFPGDYHSAGPNTTGAADEFFVTGNGARTQIDGDFGDSTGVAAGGDDVFQVTGFYGGLGSVFTGDEGIINSDQIFTGGNDSFSLNLTSGFVLINADSVGVSGGVLFGGNDEVNAIGFSVAWTISGDTSTVSFGGILHGGADVIVSPGRIFGDLQSLTQGEVYGGDDDLTALNNGTAFGDLDLIRSETNAASVVDGGDDSINGSFGNNFLYGDFRTIEAGANILASNISFGNDTIYGGGGADLIYGDYLEDLAGILSLSAGGNDKLYGESGADTLVGGGGNDILDGGTEADAMDGGYGNDRYYVDNVGDTIVNEAGFSLGGGIDTVHSTISYTLGSNLEVLRLEGTAFINGTGNGAPESFVGNTGVNILRGNGGNDTINAKAGNDVLVGGTGRDTLVGDIGADRFDYNAIADSIAGSTTRDFINGFSHGYDVIDLSDIDANLNFGGDQAWSFIGSAAFDGLGAASAGQLRFFTFGGGTFCIVEADLEGDGVADMQIFVNQTTFMSGSDFIL